MTEISQGCGLTTHGACSKSMHSSSIICSMPMLRMETEETSSTGAKLDFVDFLNHTSSGLDVRESDCDLSSLSDVYSWRNFHCQQLRHHIGLHSSHIAIIWPKNSNGAILTNELEAWESGGVIGSTLFEISFRPTTRLLTAWSHGFPTAFYPFQSYVEVFQAQFPHVDQKDRHKYGLVTSLEELQTFVHLIMRSDQWRQALSKKLVNASLSYSIDFMLEEYVSTLDSLFFGEFARNMSLLDMQRDLEIVAVRAKHEKVKAAKLALL